MPWLLLSSGVAGIVDYLHSQFCLVHLARSRSCNFHVFLAYSLHLIFVRLFLLFWYIPPHHLRHYV